MARIRTIKPEFWTSEQVMNCSPMARLLFIGLWNFCDDGGNHVASAKTIKANVFPGDDIMSPSVQLLLDELSANGLIVYYSHENKDFLHVTGWHHQKIDKPTYKHPRFDPEKSTPPRRALAEPSPPEGMGKGSGMEGKRNKPGEGSSIPSQDDAADGPAAVGDLPADPFAARRNEIAALMRKHGIAGHAGNPPVDRWAKAGATDAQILTAFDIAHRRREDQRNPQPPNPGYVDPILADVMTAEGAKPQRQQTAANRAAAWGAEMSDLIAQQAGGDRREIDMGVIDATDQHSR